MSLPKRLETELDLLYAMYPDEITFTAKSRELRYDHENGTLILRLPDHYPVSGGLPEIVSANDSSKNDIRQQMVTIMRSLSLAEGEEALDAILASFQDIMAHQQSAVTTPPSGASTKHHGMSIETELKTTIIWLHHLLATSKRKQALSPSLPDHGISGITKPGYPGVMIFSGPATAVDEHVTSLKRLNWQAFQVRYEGGGGCIEGAGGGGWEYEHGKGIREVKTMAEVVKDIVGQRRQEEFLKAVGAK